MKIPCKVGLNIVKYKLWRLISMSKPLADRIRPENLDEVFGQKHLIGEDMPLRIIVEKKVIPNMIFYGPSGTGKTTIANIITKITNKKLYQLNATNASVADIKAIISDLDGYFAKDGVVLYLDEIQNFNKKQQQSLLEYVEKGQITLIAGTTENPSFYIYNALLSRCSVFEFKELSDEDLELAVRRAVEKLNESTKVNFTDEAIEYIAINSCGDCRRAINAVEMCVLIAKPDKENVLHVNEELAQKVTGKNNFRYDKFGDSHYDILSAFQKSIRGSDENAALHYLARLLSAGDMISPIRRLLVIASEDIGLAYPQAASIVNSLCDSATRLGLPEARIPLAQAVILLATAPKSNSVICAIDMAMEDVTTINCGDIPLHLKDAHYAYSEKLGRGTDYKYPHNYKNHYVTQQYLPDPIKTRIYYNYADNKLEQQMKAYAEKIGKKTNK